jgi:death-on-curing protein
MLFLRQDEVLQIHRRMIEQFGGTLGVRDEGLLESALLAPANRWHYEDAGLAVCAATYAFHLPANRPFVDGNKRVAAAVAEVFVRLNGGRLAATNDEIVDLVLGIAAGVVARDEVEARFACWVSPPSPNAERDAL